MNHQFCAFKKGNSWQNYANQVLSGSTQVRTWWSRDPSQVQIFGTWDPEVQVRGSDFWNLNRTILRPTECLTIYFNNLSLGPNWVATAWTNGRYLVSSFWKNGVEQLVLKEVNYLKVSELISAMVSCQLLQLYRKSLPMLKVIVKLAGIDHSCCWMGIDLLLFSFFLSFFLFFFFGVVYFFYFGSHLGILV